MPVYWHWVLLVLRRFPSGSKNALSEKLEIIKSPDNLSSNFQWPKFPTAMKVILALALSTSCTKKISKRVKKCLKWQKSPDNLKSNFQWPRFPTAMKVICFRLPTKFTREVSTPSYLLYNNKKMQQRCTTMSLRNCHHVDNSSNYTTRKQKTSKKSILLACCKIRRFP